MAAYFNNPPQPTTSHPPPDSHLFPTNDAAPSTSSLEKGDNSHVPRPKRIACVVCRRRKLRCDGKRPSCGTCSRLGHECAYDEVRRKSGPKRGYVKQLEARLAQVETLLKTDDQPTAQTSQPQSQENDFNVPIPMSIGETPALREIHPLSNDMGNPIVPLPATAMQPQMNEAYCAKPDVDVWNGFEWDMISLGLEEPLPVQEVIDELDQGYFQKIHPAHPIIHPPRYFAAMKLAPHARPPVALRYIMWSLAAAVSDKYEDLRPHFYQRARKYAEMDEMKDHGEHIVSVAYCQTWLLISTHEFKFMCLPRAWLSVGKAIRLVLMMGLHRLDGTGLDVKLCIPPARDWTEKEERRRVFWMAFCADRYASTGTGWPMVIDERDIMTNLPASEESFIKGKPCQTSRLANVVSGEGISTLSPYGSVVLLTCFIGRELLHLHRPDPQDNEHDLNGEFWKRHRNYDNLLLHSALSAPNHLRLPVGIGDPNVIFWNMGVHSATICLHQAAIFKAEKNKLPNSIVMEGKRRCIVAADQISSIMRMISHTDLSTLNPFMSFCVYIAGRVFAQYLKSRPDDSVVRSSLEFIVSALNALKSKNPLTESFLAQLEVDLDGMGLRGTRAKKDVSSLGHFNNDPYCDVDCSPLIGIRQTQSPAVAQKQTQEGPPTGCANPREARLRPSMDKGAFVQQPSPNSSSAGIDMQGFTNSPNNRSPNLEAAGQRIMEMGFSSDMNLSERMNPPSDNPTPLTMNSSSNTSYSTSKSDYPSPQKHQQQSFRYNPSQAPASSLCNTNQGNALSNNTPPNQFEDINTLASRLFPTNAEALPSSTAADAPFSMSPSWNLPGAQTPAAGDADAAPSGIGSFDETQWAQLLAVANWGAWPQES